MSEAGGSRSGLIGLGIALGAAGVGTAVGIAADRINRARKLAEALDTDDSYVFVPTDEIVVVADDGVPLHVEIDEPDDCDRTRPTVVFSHGYCLTSQSWVLQRRTLSAAGYRVVVWDQRGHGKSEKGEPESYTIDQCGNDLMRVLAQTCPDGPLALVGHSMGGMTIMALAEEFPALVRDRVVALAFVATSPGGAPMASGGPASFGKLLLGRMSSGIFGELAKRPGFVDNVLGASVPMQDVIVARYSFGSPVPSGIVTLARKMLLGTDLFVVSGFSGAFDNYDKIPAMKTFLGVETLVFNGDRDVLTPPEHSESIVRLIPGAEHIVIHDAGHVIMLEHPEVFNAELLALLERAQRAHAKDESTSEQVRKPRRKRTVTNVVGARKVAEGVKKLRRTS